MKRSYRLKLCKRNCIEILAHELNIQGLHNRQCNFMKIPRQDKYFFSFWDSAQNDAAQAFFTPWDGGFICQIEYFSNNQTVTYKLNPQYLIDSGCITFITAAAQ